MAGKESSPAAFLTVKGVVDLAHMEGGANLVHVGPMAANGFVQTVSGNAKLFRPEGNYSVKGA